MPEQIELSPQEAAGLLAVLKHPDHQSGLEHRYFTVTGIAERAANLVRLTAIVSGDDDLMHWEMPNPTVRIAIPEPPEEFAAIPGVPQSTSRVYTLAEVDAASRTVAIDLVRHGESSPAMRWLAALAVGDRIDITGPRPHRIPGEGSPRVLLADSSALPAAARIAAAMPHAAITLIAAVPEDEIALLSLPETVRIHRVDPHAPQPLATAFASLDLAETTSVWAAGEREDVREVRRRCKHELGLPAEQTQVFGYWKLGMTNTRLDIARLRAAQRVLTSGGTFSDSDDFEIEL